MAGDWLSISFETLYDAIPEHFQLVVVLLFFTGVIALYSVFVYYFYKSIAKRNVVSFNLDKYNNSEHPAAFKFFKIFFYIIEYIILLPMITLIWFSILAVFLLLLARGIDVITILIMSAALVATIRITCYVSENLSTELAKMVPFTLLGLSLIDPTFFNLEVFAQRIGQIPSLFSNITYYLLFIVSIEFIMRAIELIISFYNGETDED